MTEERGATGGPAEGLVVVAGIDFTDGSASAMREALRLARHGLAGSVHATYVVPESESHARKHPDDDAAELQYGQKRLRDFVAGYGGDGVPDRIGIHVRIGDPVEELHRVAAELDADMLVIGPHEGKLFKSRPVGGIAKHIVQGARCPVLIARRKDYSDMERDQIDPPCPECVQVRRETGGDRWWCDEHTNSDRAPHLYSAYEPIPWSEHDSEAVPTGVGPGRP